MLVKSEEIDQARDNAGLNDVLDGRVVLCQAKRKRKKKGKGLNSHSKYQRDSKGSVKVTMTKKQRNKMNIRISKAMIKEDDDRVAKAKAM